MRVGVVVLGVELAAAVALGLVARRLRARSAAVDAEPQPEPAPGNPVITVEIRNAQELAAKESWAARRFGSLVPGMVNREVAAKAAQRMADQLAEQGVRAEVRVVAPPPR